MLCYRFDVPNQLVIYRKDDSKETKIKFSEMFDQIYELSMNPQLFQEICSYSEDLFRHGKSPIFRTFINDFILKKQNKAAWSFMLEVTYDLAKYHGHKYCHSISINISKYIKENLMSQFHLIETALPLYITPSINKIQFPESLKYKSYCTVISGTIYRKVEEDTLAYCPFLLEFMDALHAANLTICKCSACGKLFCGQSGENCCTDSYCKKIIEHEQDSSQDPKTQITKTKRRFDDKIQHDKAEIRNKCYPNVAEAEEEYSAYVKPLQNKVSAKAKELRRDDAPLQEIISFRAEAKSYYDGITEKKNEVIAKYGIDSNS